MVNMGNKLRSLREERNLTQKQIADRIGVTVSAISAYEAGIRFPALHSVAKLASIYHVSTDYLLGVDERKQIDISKLNDEQRTVILQLVELFSRNEP